MGTTIQMNDSARRAQIVNMLRDQSMYGQVTAKLVSIVKSSTQPAQVRATAAELLQTLRQVAVTGAMSANGQVVLTQVIGEIIIDSGGTINPNAPATTNPSQSENPNGSCGCSPAFNTSATPYCEQINFAGNLVSPNDCQALSVMGVRGQARILTALPATGIYDMRKYAPADPGFLTYPSSTPTDVSDGLPNNLQPLQWAAFMSRGYMLRCYGILFQVSMFEQQMAERYYDIQVRGYQLLNTNVLGPNEDLTVAGDYQFTARIMLDGGGQALLLPTYRDVNDRMRFCPLTYSTPGATIYSAPNLKQVQNITTTMTGYNALYESSMTATPIWEGSELHRRIFGSHIA